MAHSEHKTEPIHHNDGGLHIVEHLLEPDSFLMVVVAAGAALVVVLIMALIFLEAMGKRVIPPGHDRAGTSSQTILPTTEFNAHLLSVHLSSDVPPAIRL